MAKNDDLAGYLSFFEADRPTLNRGLAAGTNLAPIPGQPGLFRYGLEALYGDELSVYDAAPLRAPDVALSGLEATPAVPVDLGGDLSVRAVQIFLNSLNYKGADGKSLNEDGTWGTNTAFALNAWKSANAGKTGGADFSVNQRTGVVFVPTSAAYDAMRSRLLLVPRGKAELVRFEASQAKSTSTARNAVGGNGEQVAGAGNAFETAPNVRAILRSLGSRVASAGAVDRQLVLEWQRIARSFGLNDAVSAQAGAWSMQVNATTLSALRVKARNAGRPVTQTGAGTTTAVSTTGKVAPTAGTVPVKVSEIQEVLISLGAKINPDKKFGPNTANAYRVLASARNLDPAITGRVGATIANVNTTTFAALQADAHMGASGGSSLVAQPVNAATTPTTVPTAPTSGMVEVPTSTVQAILVRLKWKPTGLTDGKFGPRSKTAWETSSKSRGIDGTIVGATGARTVRVVETTLTRLKRDADMGYVNPPYGPTGAQTPVTPAAPAKPQGPSEETPPRSGLTKVTAGSVQDILTKLKYTYGTRDGKYGPKTEKAWKRAAANRDFDGTIARASLFDAWVVPATYEALSKLAGGDVGPGPKPQPNTADGKLDAVPADVLTTVMRGFGIKAGTPDGIVKGWQGAASSMKLAPAAKFEGATFRAVKATADALFKEAQLRLNVAELVRQSTADVLMKTVHDALLFWTNRDDVKKAYPTQSFSASPYGQWSDPTQVWLLRYLNIPTANTTMWEQALLKLVPKSGKSVKLPPKFAQQIGTDALNYQKVKGLLDKKKDEQKKNEAEEQRLRALIDEQAKKCTVLVSVGAIQRALSELVALQAAGKVPPTPRLPAVQITKTWNDATARGVEGAYGNDLLGKVPGGLWGDLLKKLLVRNTHLYVTPATAKNVAKAEAGWLLRTGQKKPTDETVVLPPGGSGKVVQGDTQLITGKTPKQVISPGPVEQPSPTGPAPSPFVPVAQDTSNAGGQAAGGAGGQGGSSNVSINIPGPSAPDAPAPAPSADTPSTPAAQEASVTGGSSLWIIGGIAALAAGLALNKNEGTSRARPTAPRAGMKAQRRVKRRSGKMRATR